MNNEVAPNKTPATDMVTSTVQDNKTRRRIWVQHVAVHADELQTRVNAARSGGNLDASQKAIADGVDALINKARQASLKQDPKPRALANWWRGVLVEAAYRNLHTARSQIVDLYDKNELDAEVPVALSRAQKSLDRDDLRNTTVEALTAEPAEQLRPKLRLLIDESYQAQDGQHAQLRSFRNIVLLSAILITLLVGLTVIVVAYHPTWMPLCFPNEVETSPEPEPVTDTEPTIVTTVVGKNCPTSEGPDGAPSGADIVVVALLGALGGALAASVSIRNLRGTSTPYDLSVALAWLKFPLGAFTAILALVAIRGDFVPGLSVLDSQEQILAYALVFGFAQQVFTQFLDKRAQTLLEEMPGGTAAKPPPRPAAGVGGPAVLGAKDLAATTDQPEDLLPTAELPFDDVEVVSSDEPVETEPEDDVVPAPVVATDEVVEPDQLADQGDEVQDDEAPEIEPASEEDH
jgi:hypothetical protein